MWKQELQLTSSGILEPKWPGTCPTLGQNDLAFKRYLNHSLVQGLPKKGKTSDKAVPCSRVVPAGVANTPHSRTTLLNPPLKGDLHSTSPNPPQLTLCHPDPFLPVSPGFYWGVLPRGDLVEEC